MVVICNALTGHCVVGQNAAAPASMTVKMKAAHFIAWYIGIVLGLCSEYMLCAQQPMFTPPTPLTASEAQRQAQLGSRGVTAHDPSTIIKCKNEYWMFCTGRGIRSYRSKDLVKWEPGPVVFTNAPAWVKEVVPQNRSGRDFWAPDVAYISGRYLLYYSVSSFGKNTSAIGLAVNRTLDPSDPAFHWQDEGIVVQSCPTNDFNAIDPAVYLDLDGRFWMVFGSFWSGVKLVELDPKTGKRITPDSPIYPLAYADAIEAPFLYRRGQYYYLFVNHGFCCRGTNSTYVIRVGRSQTITGPYLDHNGTPMLSGGGKLVLGTDDIFVGPGHAGVFRENGKFWFSFHFYNAAQGGVPTFGIRQLFWDADGWPVVEKSFMKQ